MWLTFEYRVTLKYGMSKVSHSTTTVSKFSSIEYTCIVKSQILC